MRMSKGTIGIEFIVATAIFLGAFWFIYLQSTVMLTPQLQRADVREMGVEFYSSILATDAEEGFAYETGGTVKPNILDKDKLLLVDGLPCSEVQSNLMSGMEFAFKVTSSTGSWECVTDIPKNGVVDRPIFIRTAANAYHAAVLEVWAA